MQMTWLVLLVPRAKVGSPAAYPPGCLGTGTAPAVERAPFLRIQGLKRRFRAGQCKRSAWAAVARVAVPCAHLS